MCEMAQMTEILQLEDGRLLWLNPATNIYEAVGQCNSSASGSGGSNSTPNDSIENPGSPKSPLQDNKLWNSDETLLLIRLVKKYNDELELGVKKYVWKKISDEIHELTKNTSRKIYTPQQIETKWKGLVKYYKDIRKWNSTSGNSRKEWKFYKVIDDILFQRPEICPEATCDSHVGLFVKKNKIDDSSDAESENTFQSNFAKKRKIKESVLAQRHSEKMKKLDRLADIMEKLVESVSRKTDN